MQIQHRTYSALWDQQPKLMDATLMRAPSSARRWLSSHQGRGRAESGQSCALAGQVGLPRDL